MKWSEQAPLRRTDLARDGAGSPIGPHNDQQGSGEAFQGFTAGRPGGSEITGRSVRPAAATEMKPVRRFGVLWLGGLILLELAILFAVAELVAAWFLPPGQRYVNPQMLIEPHAGRIYYHRPNQQAFTVDQPFVTNSLGFRDERELPPVKDGEFRIFMLGDSMTVGLGSAMEDTFARRLEHDLTSANRPVRVVNGAVYCYSTWQELDVLKETGSLVQPDLVTLVFYWNDLYPKPVPIVPLAKEQSGEQRDARQKYARLLKRSRVLQFVRERWAGLINLRWPDVDWAHRDVIYRGETNPYLEQAYHDVEASLEEFASLSRGRFVPLLVLLPMPLQVQQPEEPPIHMQQRIAAIAQRAGLRTLDLLPALRQAHAEQPGLYLPWDNEHFSPRGHEVVAKALRRYVMAHRLIPSQARHAPAEASSR